MAPLLSLGSQNLASYLKVSKEDGMDPGGSGFDEPRFADSPIGDGADLIQHTYANREHTYPLKLSGTTKDGLHDLVTNIKAEARKDPLVLAFRDDGASDTSYFDVEAARWDPDFNYRRGVARHVDGVLKVWTRPFAHTGTYKQVASSIASGMALSLTPATVVEGDVDGELDVRIVPGVASYWKGAIVGLSALPDPAWKPYFPAASLGPLAVSAALTGATGAPGSQYLGIPNGASPFLGTGDFGRTSAFAATIQASAHRGLNRILTSVRAFGNFGNASPASFNSGPEVVELSIDGKTWANATTAVDGGYGILDLGVINVKGDEGALPIVVYKRSWDDVGIPRPLEESEAPSYGFPLAIGGLYVLPEETTTIVVDSPYSRTSGDDFGDTWALATATLDGAVADGGEWVVSSPSAPPLWNIIGGRPGWYASAGALTRVSAQLDTDPLDNLLVEAGFTCPSYAGAGSLSSGVARVRSASSPFGLHAYYLLSGVFELRSGNGGGFVGSVMATVAAPNATTVKRWTMAVGNLGDTAFARLSFPGLGTTLTLSASAFPAAETHLPRFDLAAASSALNGGAIINWLRAGQLASEGRGPSQAFRVKTNGEAVLLDTVASTVARRVDQRRRGVIPAQSGTYPLFAFRAGAHPVAGNDLLTADVRVRERWSYLR